MVTGNAHVTHLVRIPAVTIRFAGDSGDGMQLAGTQFTDTSALLGNDVSTFPDYPSEIRAPAGTIAGVSGYQIQFASADIFTPGDDCDVLVAMNPAALKVNLGSVKPDGLILVNSDAFTPTELKKAGYAADPLPDITTRGLRVIRVPMDTLNAAAVAETGLNPKQANLCKNFFALGLVYWLFGRALDPTLAFIDKKLAKKNPVMAAADEKALRAGFNYGETCELFHERYTVDKAPLPAGQYRRLTGNEATVLGLAAAARLADKELFYGSYPITPASEILHGLAELKHQNVVTFQAEDEICAMGATIGAAFGGAIAVTGTSGPGLSLKTEAMGLAVMTELPMVIVNVQRGGPSTGLPTKVEQSDLMQALHGRNGECPMPVIAAASPADCFDAAIEAVRIAVGYMTPVLLLTDGFIGNSSEPWRIPDESSLAPIAIHHPGTQDAATFKPYARDARLVRPWALPGTPGLEHRIGGLEKADITGCVSHDPKNHEKMTRFRAAKVAGISPAGAPYLWTGPRNGDLLLVSWGGTYGAVKAATLVLQRHGLRVSQCHLRYIHPLPADLQAVFAAFTHLAVAELNLGQLRQHLQAALPQFAFKGINKVCGQPFSVGELVGDVHGMLDKADAAKPGVWVRPDATPAVASHVTVR